MVLLEAFGCSRPWLFNPLEVSSVVIVVDVGEKIATMQPIVAMCLGLSKRLLLSTSVGEGGGGILEGTRSWNGHGNRAWVSLPLMAPWSGQKCYAFGHTA